MNKTILGTVIEVIQITNHTDSEKESGVKVLLVVEQEASIGIKGKSYTDFFNHQVKVKETTLKAGDKIVVEGFNWSNDSGRGFTNPKIIKIG